MVTTVYADILIVVNIYISWFLIRGTEIFLHLRAGRFRRTMGALFGGFCSLAMFLPELPGAAAFLVRAVMCALAVLISFGYGGKRRFLRTGAFFIVINAVFAGGMLLLQYLFSPAGIYCANGVTYLEADFLTLVVSTLLSYIIVRLVRRFLDTRLSAGRTYRVRVYGRGGFSEVPALADSGNKLTDVWSGLPVIVCDYEEIKNIVPNGVAPEIPAGDAVMPEGIRLLPYTTVSGGGLITAYRPERVEIIDQEETRRVDALIGLSRELGENKAIFSPTLLS